MDSETIRIWLIIGAFLSGTYVLVDSLDLNWGWYKRVCWVLFCTLLWCIGVPVYLLYRKRCERHRVGAPNAVPQSQVAPDKKGSLSLTTIGKVLIVVGTILLFRAAAMDVTVPVESLGVRVTNLSLMSERSTSLGLGAVMLIVGLLAIVAASRKDRPTSATHLKCPDCAELVRREAKVCKHCGCKLIPQ